MKNFHIDIALITTYNIPTIKQSTTTTPPQGKNHMRLTDQESIATMSAELELISSNINCQHDLMQRGLAFNTHLDYFFSSNSYFPAELMKKEVFEAMPGYQKLLNVCRQNDTCLEMILDKPSDARPDEASGSVVAAFYKGFDDSCVFLKGECVWKATPGTTPAKPPKPRAINSPDDFGGFAE
jgi:hypothetical protein